MTDSSWLATIEHFARTEVAPQAEAMDQDPQVLRAMLQVMGDRTLLALRVPQSWGGAGVSQLCFHRIQLVLARYSGALTFLQAQHQSAGNLLSQGENDRLKQEVLPQMGRGQRLIGVGFSHLRRPGAPVLKAIPATDGYRLQGTVPWLTGWQFFHQVILGATLPDGQTLYGLVPFVETDLNPDSTQHEQPHGGCIRLSDPLGLAVMGVTNTVTATVDDWWLPASQVVAIKPGTAIQASDRHTVLHHGFYALGCARAGLDILAAASDRPPSIKPASLATVFAQLHHDVDQCEAAMLGEVTAPSSYPKRLQLRVRAIDLAARCAMAAMTVSGGAGNQLHHPAQRIYREAMMVRVAGQTPDIMAASLDLMAMPSTD